MTKEIFAFGKYKGQSIVKIAKSDPQYVQWAVENVSNFSLPKGIKLSVTKISGRSYDRTKGIRTWKDPNLLPDPDYAEDALTDILGSLMGY